MGIKYHKKQKEKKKNFLALVKREREREPSWYLKQIKTKTFLKLMTVLFCLFFFFLLSAAFVQLSLFFVFLFLSGCELALSDDDKANHSSTRTFQNRIIFTYTNSHTLVIKEKRKHQHQLIMWMSASLFCPTSPLRPLQRERLKI